MSVVLLNVLAVFGAAFGRTIVVPALPASPYADTEAVTNVVLHAGRTDVREASIHLRIAGTPTNELEIAFGRDANGNGALDAEETETVYGWRGGRYFIENAEGWERFEAEAVAGAAAGAMDVLVENGADVVPRRFSAICGGAPAFAGLSTPPPPEWLFRERWDVARVTRRGAGAPSEWVRCKVGYNRFLIQLR